MKPSPSSNGFTVLNQVEFSNNGVLDSLTGAPAPKIFFDNLAREISKSKRKFEPISIVTVQVLPDFTLASSKSLGASYKTKNKNVQNENRQNETDANLYESAYEIELISVGRCLKTNMRSGDFYSRIADNGFWICLQGDAIDSEKAVKRFALKILEAKNLENKSRRKAAGRNSPREEPPQSDSRHSTNKELSLNKDQLIVEHQRAKFVICEWDGTLNEAEWIQEIDLLYFGS